MVGVAGKSQACNTCRERRVKCDLGRPSCQKCISTNRTCTGYSRDRIFVNRTPSTPSSTALSVISELKAQRQLENISASSNTNPDLHHLFAETEHNCHRFRVHAVDLLQATFLPKRTASDLTNDRTGQGSFSWIYRLTDLVAPSKSSDTALYAFCLAQLRLTGLASAPLYQCLEQYSTALQHLYSDLADSERRFQEETLAAILVLSNCELFVDPTQGGWSAHARGIANIMRLRDPGLTNTPAWRHLSSRLRVVCILEGLTKLQPHYSENDVWRQIASEPGYDHPLDQVFQIFAEVPAILERVAPLASYHEQSVLLEKSAAVVQSLLVMVKAIISWHDQFCNASQSPRYRLVPSCASNPADVHYSDKLFPYCFEFQSLSVAVPVVMSWAVSAQLYSSTIQILDFLQARLDRHIDLADLLLPTDTNAIEAVTSPKISSQVSQGSSANGCHSIQEVRVEGRNVARRVCQSMEYYHRIEMGTWGGHATTYPSWSARQYFRLHPGCDREWLWLQNLHKMEGPETRWGLSLMKFEDIPEPLGGWPSDSKMLRNKGLSGDYTISARPLMY